MKMSYIEAINSTISNEMKKNKKLIILGQDIRLWGGASGAFKGLYKKYDSRILDTPISEAGTVGIGIGAAMSGLRPIIEFTFFDFILTAMDPIINHVAKIKHLSAGNFNLPIIIRCTISSNRGYGATHSQNLEHMFMYPGLNVVYPSTPNDAAGLLKTSLESSDPIIFLEHKLLHQTSGKVSDKKIPLGKARVRKRGNKLTIITYGRTVQLSLDVTKDKDIEVLDLRSLQPLDIKSILRSSNKTKNVLIVEDGHGFISAEIKSKIHENLDNIKVERLYTKQVPIPASKILEDKISVTKEKISKRIDELLKA